jgi:rubrerythrin
MEKFSVREVIEQAVQTEKLGYEFYVEMANRFKKDEKLKKLFETLAAKERLHEKMFKELKDIISDEEPENWDEASQYMRAIVESEFFLGKNKSLLSLKHLKTREDAVNFALGFEKETLLYFYSLRDVVREKEILDEIISDERSHIKWLDGFKKSFMS